MRSWVDLTSLVVAGSIAAGLLSCRAPEEVPAKREAVVRNLEEQDTPLTTEPVPAVAVVPEDSTASLLGQVSPLPPGEGGRRPGEGLVGTAPGEGGRRPGEGLVGTAPDFGIEPQALRLTAGGYMLDFRYKVTDPDKVRPIMNPKVRPYLKDRESGAVFLVPTPPKIGALRQTFRGTPPRKGAILGMMFANPGQFIKPGCHVDIIAGDCTIADLVVE